MSKWAVNDQNLNAVCRYLKRNGRLAIIERLSPALMNVADVQETLDNYLEPDELTKLRAALRKEKSRASKWRKPDMDVTISKDAYKALSIRKAEDNISHSECIAVYFTAINSMSEHEREQFLYAYT